MVYYIVPALAFLGTLITYKRRWRDSSLYLWVLIVVMGLVLGMFRGEYIGQDYVMYYYVFTGAYPAVEVGVMGLIDIMKSAGFHAFLGLVFMIAYLSKTYSFRKASVDPFISMMLYGSFWILVYDFNGIRQGLALGFCALAVMCMIKEKPKKWLYLVTGLGICCHYSMLIFVPFLFLYKRRYNVRWMWVLAILAFALSATGLPLRVIEIFVGDTNYYASKLVSYSMNEEYNQNVIFTFSTIHKFMIFTVLMLVIPKMRLSDSFKRIFIWGAFLSIFIYLLLANVEIVATRSSLYFRFVEIFSLAAVPYYFRRKFNRIGVKTLLFLYVLSQIHATLSIPHGRLIPYTFI